MADPTPTALLRWAAAFDAERREQLAAAERGDPLGAWNAEACERQAQRLRRDAAEEKRR